MNKTLNLAKGLSDELRIDEIRQILHEMGKFDMAIAMIPEGTYLYRARSKVKNWSPSKLLELTNIRNQGIIKRIGRGRANLPEQSVFYSCTLPDFAPKYQEDCIKTALKESTKVLQSSIIQEEYSYVTCWKIKKTFPIIALVNYRHIKESKYSALYRKQFAKAYLDKHGKDNSTWYVNNLLATFFAKVYDESDPNRYKVTSEFSDWVIRNGKGGGISYPSVASDGAAINLVIFDPFIENLELQFIMKWRTYLSNDIFDTQLLNSRVSYREDFYDCFRSDKPCL